MYCLGAKAAAPVWHLQCGSFVLLQDNICHCHTHAPGKPASSWLPRNPLEPKQQHHRTSDLTEGGGCIPVKGRVWTSACSLCLLLFAGMQAGTEGHTLLTLVCISRAGQQVTLGDTLHSSAGHILHIILGLCLQSLRFVCRLRVQTTSHLPGSIMLMDSIVQRLQEQCEQGGQMICQQPYVVMHGLQSFLHHHT